jgi:hypothetical protein
LAERDNVDIDQVIQGAKAMSEAQWAEIEGAVRQAISELPDADEFTANDIGRILMRVRRINNDVLEGIGQVFKPVYSCLIGEVVSLCVEIVRIDRKMGGNHES